MSVNKSIIVGNLGANPTLLSTTQGNSLCRLRIATNERVRRGTKVETLTMWHDVIVFGASAKACAEYLKKGAQVYVEGKHNRRLFRDPKTGDTRSISQIIAQRVVFLSGKKAAGQTVEDEEKFLPSDEISAELEKLSA